MPVTPPRPVPPSLPELPRWLYRIVLAITTGGTVLAALAALFEILGN